MKTNKVMAAIIAGSVMLLSTMTAPADTTAGPKYDQDHGGYMITNVGSLYAGTGTFSVIIAGQQIYEASGTNINMSGFIIYNLGPASTASGAVNYAQVQGFTNDITDALLALFVPAAGGTFSGKVAINNTLDMGGDIDMAKSYPNFGYDISNCQAITVIIPATGNAAGLYADAAEHFIITNRASTGYMELLVKTPTSANGATTKTYVDGISNVILGTTGDARWYNISGDTLTGNMNAGYKIINSIGDLVMGDEPAALVPYPAVACNGSSNVLLVVTEFGNAGSAGMKAHGDDDIYTALDGCLELQAGFNGKIILTAMKGITFASAMNASGKVLTNLPTPTVSSGAATKGYVDLFLPLSGGTMTDDITMYGNKILDTAEITGNAGGDLKLVAHTASGRAIDIMGNDGSNTKIEHLDTPTAASDAANKGYVDSVGVSTYANVTNGLTIQGNLLMSDKIIASVKTLNGVSNICGRAQANLKLEPNIVGGYGIDVCGSVVSNLATPTAASHAVTKAYADGYADGVSNALFSSLIDITDAKFKALTNALINAGFAPPL